MVAGLEVIVCWLGWVYTERVQLLAVDRWALYVWNHAWNQALLYITGGKFHHMTLVKLRDTHMPAHVFTHIYTYCILM